MQVRWEGVRRCGGRGLEFVRLKRPRHARRDKLVEKITDKIRDKLLDELLDKLPN